MAKYFSYYPKTFYNVNEGSASVDVITNIMSRFKMQEEFKENTSVYFKYDIKDGETPEIVAYNFYGSPERHWIVLLMNNMIDPQFDWPLSYTSLVEYVRTKYSANNYADTANTGVDGLTWSKTNTHSYYITEITESFDQEFSQKIQLDSATYANTVTGTNTITLQDGNVLNQSNLKSTLSYYEYETEENEKKRSIKLIRNEFVFALEDELRTALSQ